MVGAAVNLPAPLHVALIFLVAMSVGATYSGVAGVLKVTRGISEVISTIMLNAIAISGLLAAGLKLWQAPAPGGGNVTRLGTEEIPKSGRIPNLNRIVEIFTRDIGRDRRLTGVLVVAIARRHRVPRAPESVAVRVRPARQRRQPVRSASRRRVTEADGRRSRWRCRVLWPASSE